LFGWPHRGVAAGDRQCAKFGIAAALRQHTQALYDEAKKKGWSGISMKEKWKGIFAFD